MLKNIDLKLFSIINGFAGKNQIFDNIGIFLAKYIIYIFPVILIILYKNKKYRKPSMYSLYSAIIGIVINWITSLIYFRQRPFVVKIGTQLISHSSDASFPSDHTTFMLSIAFTLICFKETRKIGLMLSLTGLISGLSRVYVGIHYPLDILGSILVAGISSLITLIIKEKIKNKPESKK